MKSMKVQTQLTFDAPLPFHLPSTSAGLHSPTSGVPPPAGAEPSVQKPRSLIGDFRPRLQQFGRQTPAGRRLKCGLVLRFFCQVTETN